MAEIKCDKFSLIKPLGMGASSRVYLAFDPYLQNRCAIKVFDNKCGLSLTDIKANFESEVNTLKELDHPNIIRVRRAKSFGTLKRRNDTSKIMYMVLDLCPCGDLEEYVKRTGALTPELAREYFIAMIEGVKHCHDKGIAHGDLKPSNILLDEKMGLKIADFGSARQVEGPICSLRSLSEESESYQAPEIISGAESCPILSDLFSCGVTLFKLVTGINPFGRADSSDPNFHLIQTENFEKFWALFESENSIAVSDNLKDLINGLLQAVPEARLTLEEVLSHSWMKEPRMELGEFNGQMMERRRIVLTTRRRDSQSSF
eukprot:CAMPEP_0115012290 /NCGR_PEP_ID=MMETSP0216-20121206/24632_1 /TAXON_ID=223996 /ORGANISM="Protocruzia adherens, Strain Boccale" /LENGTH=316 /DNA_ID=CAMNT_0002381285 /DNA_START=357 /DNA_END=1307 /DNA_ORIENTATION=-